MGDEGETEGSLYFHHGKLLLTNLHSYGEEGEALEITLRIIWDAPSGRVRAFGCHLYVNGEESFYEFPEETFLALLRARLDDSAQDLRRLAGRRRKARRRAGPARTRRAT